MRRRRQSAKKDDVAEMSGPGKKHSPVRKDKDVISTTELSGDSIQYESLNEGHSSEVSAQQGTYAGIDASGETTGQTTYECIGADGPQKPHTYINTAVVGDDAAEYSEVKETVAAEATRGQPTYQNISTKNTAN
ncbi:hypothetical protein LSAT2_015481 [Lamellibrachia satsuma]|nr:hypothetical protein LSAT2_015481 [Lamellibrachia satsuma]